MSRARIAVIGCGWWSTEVHLPALVAHERAEVAAIVEPDPERRRVAAERFEVERAFAGLDELLDATEIDGAIVGTPPRTHHPLASRLLDAGVHTLVEKPMTVTSAQARDLLERAERNGSHLLVSYPWHFNPHVEAAREEIARGTIGELELVTCTFASIARELYRGRPERYADALGYTHAVPGTDTYRDGDSGGQGASQLTHAAALMLRMTGLEVSEVSAFTANFELEVDLVDSLALRFGSGALGSLASAGNVLPDQEEVLEFRFFGADGRVVVDVGAGTASVHGPDGARELAPLAPADRYPAAAPAGELVAATEGACAGRIPGKLGADVVALIEAMRRSQDERRAVLLDEA